MIRDTKERSFGMGSNTSSQDIYTLQLRVFAVVQIWESVTDYLSINIDCEEN